MNPYNITYRIGGVVDDCPSCGKIGQMITLYFGRDGTNLKSNMTMCKSCFSSLLDVMKGIDAKIDADGIRERLV